MRSLRKRTRRDVIGGACAALCVPLAGARPGAAQGGARTHRVTIEKFAFVPGILTVRAGDTIEWLNTDLVPHTATAKDRSWDSGSLSKNAVGAVKLASPGTIEYLCRFHPHMTGMIVVEPVGAGG